MMGIVQISSPGVLEAVLCKSAQDCQKQIIYAILIMTR